MEPLWVTVFLAPSLVAFTDPAAEGHQALVVLLRRYLDDLVSDLALPLETRLQVEPAEAGHESRRGAFRITVDNVPCRLPVRSTVNQEIRAAELAWQIATVIHRNRALFVTRRLAAQLQASWAVERPGLADLTEGLFHGLLSELARRGFRIDRAKDLQQGGEAASTRTGILMEYFERAVGHAAAVRLSLAPYVQESKTDAESFEQLLDLMQDGLFYELGLRVPRVHPDPPSTLAPHEFRIRVNDVRCPPMPGLDPDQFLANDRVKRLDELGARGVSAPNPANGNECAIVRNVDGALETCREAGITTWGPLGYVILSISAEIRRNAGNLVTMEAVDYDLRFLRRAFPDLVAAATRRFDLAMLAGVVRGLLDEEISTRNLRGILESLLAINGTTDVDQLRVIAFLPSMGNLCPVRPMKSVAALEVSDYVNSVRMSFKQYISHKFTKGAATLLVYLVNPEAEARVADADRHPLSPEEHERLIEAVYKEVGGLPPSPSNPVILTTIEARGALRQLIEVEFPDLAVLCYQELSPEMNIQPLARISFLP